MREVKQQKEDEATADRAYHAPFMWFYFIWCVLIAPVPFATLIRMTLSYRETVLDHLESSTTGWLLEPTSNTSIRVSLGLLASKLPYEVPTKAWSDSVHVVLFDPMNAWTIFTSIWGSILIVVILWHICKHYTQGNPKQSLKCCDSHYAKHLSRPGSRRDPDYSEWVRDCCGCYDLDNPQTLCAFWFIFVFSLILLIGGAVVGARYNKLEEGICGGEYTADGDHWTLMYRSLRSIREEPNGVGQLYQLAYSSRHVTGSSECWLDNMTVDTPSITFNDPFPILVYFFVVMFFLMGVYILLGCWCCPCVRMIQEWESFKTSVTNTCCDRSSVESLPPTPHECCCCQITFPVTTQPVVPHPITVAIAGSNSVVPISVATDVSNASAPCLND